MATLAITFTAGSETGAMIRKMADQLERMAGDIPDLVSSSASTVLTFDNAPSSGTISMQITAGPHTTGVFKV